MKFAYENQNGTIKIHRCFGYGAVAELPESLEGCPVTELAPYAFSSHLEERGLEEKLRRGQVLFSDGEEAPALVGERLTEVCLPKSLRRIGAYAFYNCSALESFSFHSGLKDLGPGLFTGCHHVRRLELTLDETDTSCLQEILMELSEELRLTLYKGGEEARLVFPEFYEEGVENTPARILMTQMHGSGMHFRNCFYQRRFDFHGYDSCFFRAKAQESEVFVLELALLRLRFPMELGMDGRGEYEAYLREHLQEAGLWAIEKQEMVLLRWLVREFLSGHSGEETLLRQLLGQAAERGFAEGNAFLLDRLHQRFPVFPSIEERFEF